MLMVPQARGAPNPIRRLPTGTLLGPWFFTTVTVCLTRSSLAATFQASLRRKLGWPQRWFDGWAAKALTKNTLNYIEGKYKQRATRLSIAQSNCRNGHSADMPLT
jgi:hypothetical protein